MRRMLWVQISPEAAHFKEELSSGVVALLCLVALYMYVKIRS